MTYKIRVAEEKDAQAIHDIYEACVAAPNITFTTENPSVKTYREKIIHTKEMYPFYVAEAEDGTVLGYVCGSRLRPHDAYLWNVESTIALSPDAPHRAGIATALYEKFNDTLASQGFRFVYGVIVDDNEPSIKMHEKLGFTLQGHFTDVGYKDGKWRGIVWYSKQISVTPGEPLPPIPFINWLEKQSQEDTPC